VIRAFGLPPGAAVSKEIHDRSMIIRPRLTLIKSQTCSCFCNGGLAKSRRFQLQSGSTRFPP
jgi:hypothetical protein